MGARVMEFRPRPRKDAIHIRLDKGVAWVVTLVEANETRTWLGEYGDRKSAYDFALRAAFARGKTEVLFIRGGE